MTDIVHSPFVAGTEGVFNIPSEIYHDHVKAPDVSRSMIVRLLESTPAHLKAVLDGQVELKVTKAMDDGTLIDNALLEPDKFKEGLSHWVKPEGLKLSTKEGIAWKKDHPDLPILRKHSTSIAETSVRDINGMIDSVLKHPLARRIVENSTKQESAFCHCPRTGLLRKCRPDNRLTESGGRMVLADLKSTFLGGASKHEFRKHARKYGYHIQDPFYSDIYEDLLGEKPFFVFYVVEKKPPYVVRIFQLDEQVRTFGRQEYIRALETMAACREADHWPGHKEEIEIIEFREWALKSSE